MSTEQVRVTFEPQGRAVYVLPGTKVLEAAGAAGLSMESPCGGKGTCGKCRVQFTHGAPPPGKADQALFDAEQLQAGWRLACQAPLAVEAVVFVPPNSLFASSHQIFMEAQRGPAEEVLPAIRKVFVQLDPPSLADETPDLMRLEKAVGPIKADLRTLQQFALRLRKGNFSGTAVLTDHHLMDFELGDTSGQCYGVAVDIGTTTLVSSLMDLCTGEELAIASSINPQTSFGDDVLSRIMYAATEKGLKELRGAVVTAISALIDQLCGSAGISRDRIYDFACAGNTTMEHLFCGVDVGALAVVPFVPAYGRGLVLAAEDVGLKLHPRAAVYVFPVIGGFVGGDTVAGMVATKLAQHPGAVLLIDVGTNGEIVLAHEGQLLAASTAAGPAFEGARIACGMRASAGAIEKVIIDDDVQINVIDNARPTGLCGSGLIDLAAELLTAGVINSGGRLLPPTDLPPGLSEALRRRVALDANGRVEFVLVEADAHGPRVFLSERDVRELQLATGAIRAGVNILLRRAGLKTEDLSSVLIAGGFGSFIRRSKAQRIGLLPAGLPHERIRYVGNASLDGAKWALLSTRAHDLAEQLARKTQHVNLSEDLEFQMEFAEAMLFPD